jgi:hypothetical protein
MFYISLPSCFNISANCRVNGSCNKKFMLFNVIIKANNLETS